MRGHGVLGTRASRPQMGRRGRRRSMRAGRPRSQDMPVLGEAPLPAGRGPDGMERPCRCMGRAACPARVSTRTRGRPGVAPESSRGGLDQRGSDRPPGRRQRREVDGEDRRAPPLLGAPARRLPLDGGGGSGPRPPLRPGRSGPRPRTTRDRGDRPGAGRPERRGDGVPARDRGRDRIGGRRRRVGGLRGPRASPAPGTPRPSPEARRGAPHDPGPPGPGLDGAGRRAVGLPGPHRSRPRLRRPRVFLSTSTTSSPSSGATRISGR